MKARKLIVLGLCALMALSLPAMAAEHLLISPAPVQEEALGYALELDGQDTGASVCVIVPLRATAEALGFEVAWNNDGTITLDDGIMHTTVTLGVDRYQVVTSNKNMVGMSAPFSLGMAPFMVNDTTYVPLELFHPLLGNLAGGVSLENDTLKFITRHAGAESSTQTDPLPSADPIQ